MVTWESNHLVMQNSGTLIKTYATDHGKIIIEENPRSNNAIFSYKYILYKDNNTFDEIYMISSLTDDANNLFIEKFEANKVSYLSKYNGSLDIENARDALFKCAGIKLILEASSKSSEEHLEPSAEDSKEEKSFVSSNEPCASPKHSAEPTKEDNLNAAQIPGYSEDPIFEIFLNFLKKKPVVILAILLFILSFILHFPNNSEKEAEILRWGISLVSAIIVVQLKKRYLQIIFAFICLFYLPFREVSRYDWNEDYMIVFLFLAATCIFTIFTELKNKK